MLASKDFAKRKVSLSMQTSMHASGLVDAEPHAT